MEEVSGYPGRLVSLGGGERIGLGSDSRSDEPTVDVTISYVPEIEKLKFE